MNEKLSEFIPKEALKTRVEVRKELAPVVERINKILPQKVLWGMFSSAPEETGGKVVFPYCRVDSAVLNARNNIYLLETYGEKYSKKEFNKWYQLASRQAFRALVWVEIGFQGLENLAVSKASVNWTSGVGHHVNDQERAEGIMTTGKEMFDECLKQFVSFREQASVPNDLFIKYKMGHLLKKFK